MKRATRLKIDRVVHALDALNEQLEREPDPEEFQAVVERARQSLAEAERAWFASLHYRSAA